jgi:hypothetical protein
MISTMIGIKKRFLSIDKWHHLFGIIGVIAVIGFYNVLFAFSFFPLTEGWFSAYAHLILDGKIPYRDFYMLLTPLYPMALSAVVGLFGESFFVLRVVGILIVISIAVLLYLILARRFSPSASMVASITACIYYQSGVAHIPYDFTQVLTLFTLAATWMLVLAANEAPSTENILWRRQIVRRVLLAGFFTTLAFLTKQSNGAFVVVAAWVGCIYVAMPWGRSCWKLIIAFAGGCLIPAAVTMVWLLQADALISFWEQIFGGALSAKGSLNHVLFAWFKGLLTHVFVIQMTTIGKWAVIIIGVSFILNKSLSLIYRPLVDNRIKFVLLASLSMMCMIVIVNSYLGSTTLATNIVEFGLSANNYIIPITTSISAVLFLIGVISCFFPTVRKYISPSVIVLGIMSAGMIWGNGTSAGLSEVGVFTMFALVLAGMLNLRLFRYAGFASALVLVVSFIFTFSSRKFDTPYTWWGVKEPSVHEAIHLSESPILRGIQMSKHTAESIDAMAASLANGPQEGDVFAFPNIPLAYLVSNRWPNSKIVVPWFDFLPDTPARAEALRLLATPPAIIVNLKLPPSAWEAHERLFREGRPLGQRDIQNAIDDLTEKRKLYQLDFSREVSPGCVLEVWHRIVF